MKKGNYDPCNENSNQNTVFLEINLIFKIIDINPLILIGTSIVHLLVNCDNDHPCRQ